MFRKIELLYLTIYFLFIVCQLLEKEKKEHSQLKRTWQMANDQFLVAQRLQLIDMKRMQSVLTSEQQRQIDEAKKKDEQKLELERQLKKTEEKTKEEKVDKGMSFEVSV